MVVRSSTTNVHPFDWMDDIVFILDAQTRFTFVNAFAIKTWAKQPHELLGHTFQEALPGHHTRELSDALQSVLASRQRAEFDAFDLSHQAWINVTLTPHEGGLIALIKRLLRPTGATVPADHDALTGCLTRASFQTALQTVSLPCLLAIIDLNLLKSINSLRGHSGGDAHIRTVAHALKDALPPEALICRWGGDEFVLLIPGHDQGALRRLLDETNETLPRPVPDTLAFTVGQAIWEQGSAFERAFAIADEELHLAKDRLRDATAEFREADSLIRFSQELEQFTEPGALVQHALDRLLNLLNVDQAAYAVIEGDETYYSHQAHRKGIPPLQPPINVRVPLSEPGMIYTVRRTRSTVWSTDYLNTAHILPLVVNQGVKSGLVTPVFSQGQVVAAIVLRTVNRWQTITPHLRRVAELTALRLEHALSLHRAVSEIRSSLEASLLTLGIILEARDAETQGHTLRTATMAQTLGESVGLTGGDLGHLRYGAYLHDLGKLAISDEILRKPAALTSEEWSVMQSHVREGYALATRIPGLPQDVLDVIRSHHERWDGSGYPDALAGTDIPLMARIFAVCDVYDALTSERPYKAAWSHQDACDEIENQAGRHFDPDVVHAFLKIFSL